MTTISPYIHSPHIPTPWLYQGSDQVSDRANDKSFDPLSVDYACMSPSMIFEPSEKEHLSVLHKACEEHRVLPIAFRTWFMENSRSVPESFEQFERIYFPGTVARHTFGVPCIPYMQRLGRKHSGEIVWAGYWSQLIPQVNFDRAGFAYNPEFVNFD